MDPDRYCQEKSAASGSSFYYSFLFLPKPKRKAITALYAFCREVDDIVDECTDESVARTKLNWWREEIQRLYQQTPRHPVTRALLPALHSFDLKENHFQEIINGMQMDLEFTGYHNFQELSEYCYRAASVVGLLSIEIFGYQDKQTLDYAINLGMAFQLTNILRDVYEDAKRGRIYIPADELDQFKLQTTDLCKQQSNQNTYDLFSYQALRAHQYYEKAFSCLPEIDRPNQKTGIIMSAIYKTLLNEIEKDGYNVLKHRIKLTPLRKLWIAWKTARKEQKLSKKSSN